MTSGILLPCFLTRYRMPYPKHPNAFTPWLLPFIPALVFAIAGCATPIGVKKVGTRNAYQEIHASVLSGKEISADTKIVLRRYGLLKQTKRDTAETISFLDEKANLDTRRGLRFALSELCFRHGEYLSKERLWYDEIQNEQAPDYFLMSAIYAYYYLFGTEGNDPGPYDYRFRLACDLYNRALGKYFLTRKDKHLNFQDGVYQLPIGALAVTHKKDSLPWPLENFYAFIPADEYVVRGLSVRNRTAGIGLPLVARHKKTPEMPKGPEIPITAFLRVEGDVQDFDKGTARATLEFYSGYGETEVIVKGRPVPLETDTTTPLAYRLEEDTAIWKLGMQKFFSPLQQEPELLMIQPYQAGRIPIVFVHGTASSPVRWAEMWNTLRYDPVLRKRCQFWFFTYNSSLTVTRSAARLRSALSDMVQNLDPEGEDHALRQMVVIGHSQGGLLAKLSVVSTGDALWRALSDHSLEELDIESEVKEFLQEFLFIEPLPFVTRVVYLATPHRGSYRAKSWVRNLVRRLVTLPTDILTGDPSVYGNLFEQSKLPREFRGNIPTSVDSMSPDNPLLNQLAEMPVSLGVKTHSIIAVEGDDDPVTGNDGVVAYISAHQEDVESEFIVRTGHSCQGHPLTIEEVRRILLSHLAELSGFAGMQGSID